MQKVLKALHEREEELTSLLQHIESGKSGSAPPGKRIRITSIRGIPRYYLCYTDPQTKKKVQSYVKKHDLQKIRKLAQQDYEHQVLLAIMKERALIRKCLSDYPTESPEDIYYHLHPARKKLLDPLLPDWEEYQAIWKPRMQKPVYNLDPDAGFVTEQGEIVRSKSEKIIADKYYSAKIHYLYEKPLELKDGRKKILLHPDFTIFKEGDFREYYHEHFGMMDQPDYCRKALRKIMLYRKNGIYEGERLFITFETSQEPLDVRDLQRVVDRISEI